MQWMTPSATDAPQLLASFCRNVDPVRGTIDVTIWSFLMPYMGYLLPSLTYQHKVPYRVSGLSADLSAMERSELHVLRRVHEERLVGAPFWVLTTLVSRVKYLKRLVHVLARRRLSS